MCILLSSCYWIFPIRNYSKMTLAGRGRGRRLTKMVTKGWNGVIQYNEITYSIFYIDHLFYFSLFINHNSQSPVLLLSCFDKYYCQYYTYSLHIKAHFTGDCRTSQGWNIICRPISISISHYLQIQRDELSLSTPPPPPPPPLPPWRC